jgi:hypothetical protein
MSTCFWSLGTPPVFHFDIAKSKFGITEMKRAKLGLLEVLGLLVENAGGR